MPVNRERNFLPDGGFSHKKIPPPKGTRISCYHPNLPLRCRNGLNKYAGRSLDTLLLYRADPGDFTVRSHWLQVHLQHALPYCFHLTQLSGTAPHAYSSCHCLFEITYRIAPQERPVKPGQGPLCSDLVNSLSGLYISIV